ncbi:MAG: 50S ribosomal protein L18 [Candidatus Paceibacterota bacterium]
MTPSTATQRERRRRRIRAKVSGTAARPRLSVFKSNTALEAQLINDETGTTLATVSSRGRTEATGVARAAAAGKELAETALKSKIDKAVFDRGGYIYTGQIKALADGAREGGLQF